MVLALDFEPWEKSDPARSGQARHPARDGQEPHAGDNFVGELPDEGINLEKLERELLEKAYAKSDYNQSKTARFLGITRNTLLYRFEKYGIEKR